MIGPSVVARITAWALGATLVYFAFFLRENVEGRVENWLIVLWKDLDRRQQGAPAAFQTAITRLGDITLRAFDRFLGERSLSKQSFGVATCFVMGLVLLLGGVTEGTDIEGHAEDGQSYALRSLGVILLAISVLPAIFRASLANWIAMFGGILVLAFCLVFWMRPDLFFILPEVSSIDQLVAILTQWPQWTDEGAEEFAEWSFLGGVLGLSALLCTPIDLVWVAVSRQTIRRAVRTHSTLTLALWNLMAISFVVLMYYLVHRDSSNSDARQDSEAFLTVYLAALVGRIPVAAVCLATLLTMLVVLANWLIWPIAATLVYPLQRFGIFRHRKAIGAFGIGLLFNSNFRHAIESLLAYFGWSNSARS
ncbi:MAG TPA: hypothetical protein VK128_06650 [Steroidobacteraceae bacterium]|nr:hypothetical protein [Steroidobacteraceae bacterium]